MWTKTSLPPASGWIKPKPFWALNHFTVPVVIDVTFRMSMFARSKNGRVIKSSERIALGPGTRSEEQAQRATEPNPYSIRSLYAEFPTQARKIGISSAQRRSANAVRSQTAAKAGDLSGYSAATARDSGAL